MNTEMNNEIVIAEIINTEMMPITMAELLEQDFHNDDEAEFLQAVLQIQMEIENVILSDNPEEFLLPTEEDLSPAMIMIEKLEELKSFRFGDRTLARMERMVRNVNEVKPYKLTESEKANHPDYTKCPECLRHFIKSYLGHHMGTAICLKVKTAHNLRPANNDKKKVSDKIYNACLDLEDLYARAVQYKKNIEPELQDEEYVEDNQICIGCEKPADYHMDDIYYCEECNDKRNDETIWDEYGNEHIGHLLRFKGNRRVLYKVKLWEEDGEYVGLYEDNEGERYWKTESEGERMYEEAIESGDWTGIEFVRVSIYCDDESVLGDWGEQYEPKEEEEEEENTCNQEGCSQTSGFNCNDNGESICADCYEYIVEKRKDKICWNCEHYDINTIDYYGELICSRCFTEDYIEEKKIVDEFKKQMEKK